MTTQNTSERPKSNRGFASMDAGKQKEIASKGGKAAHAQGRAHEFTPDEARTAGRKGGEVVSRDRAHMAAIGRAGGQARGRNRALQAVRGTQPRVDVNTSNGAGAVHSAMHSNATPAE
jgi:general stress protein YciG